MQPPSITMQPPSSPPSPRQPQSPPPIQTPRQPIPPPPGQAQPITSPPPIITQPPPKPTPPEVISPPSSSRKKAQVSSPSSSLPPPEAISPPSSRKKPQVSSSPSSPLPPPPGRNESVTSPTDVPLSYPPHPNLTPNRETRATTQGKWSTGLFECFSDLRNCAITCLCPCITFGEISEIVDKGTTSCAVNGAIYTLMVVLVGFACIYSAFYRRRMRIQLNLEGSSCGDCCIHSFCEVCALCQEYRELRLRGFDLSLGWHANMDRQNQGAITTPPPHSSMRR